MRDDLKAGRCAWFLRSTYFCLLPSAFLLAALAGPALAQAPGKTSVADVALYQGTDRAQRLAEGAKKEGVVSVYTSATVADMAILTAAFEKKHGIKVNVWRASSEGIIQRGVSEMRGGRNEADIFETNGPDMESLHREKVLQEAASPHFADLVPGAVAPHREWVGARINIYVMTYNTKLVRKEDLPRSFEDLAHPRWKGKLGIEASDPAWFAMIVNELGEAKGLKIFRDIVTASGTSPATTRFVSRESRRARRLVHPAAGDRPLPGHGACPPRAPPPRRDAVLRLHADGRAGTPGAARFHGHQPEVRFPGAKTEPQVRRSQVGAR